MARHKDIATLRSRLAADEAAIILWLKSRSEEDALAALDAINTTIAKMHAAGKGQEVIFGTLARLGWLYAMTRLFESAT